MVMNFIPLAVLSRCAWLAPSKASVNGDGLHKELSFGSFLPHIFLLLILASCELLSAVLVLFGFDTRFLHSWSWPWTPGRHPPPLPPHQPQGFQGWEDRCPPPHSSPTRGIKEKAVSSPDRERGWGCPLRKETGHWCVATESRLSNRYVIPSVLTAPTVAVT